MSRTLLGSTVVWVALTLTAAALLSPEPAAACSGNPCFGPRLEPPGGEVPEDFLILTFWPARDARIERDGPPQPQLYAIDSDTGARTALAIDLEELSAGRFSVRPQQPVAAGTRLVFEAETVACTDDPALHSEILVTEQRDVPAALGKLHVDVKRSALRVATISGSCDVVIDAVYADIEVDLSDEAKPFADILRYELRLDGKSHLSFADSLIASSVMPRGHDRVYAQCPDSDYAGPLTDAAATLGKHRLRVVGSLPDGTTVASEEVTIELKCKGPPVEIDAGSDDMGPLKPGGTSSQGVDAGGCAAVRSHGSHAPVAAWSLAFSVAAALWRTRRRRSAGQRAKN